MKVAKVDGTCNRALHDAKAELLETLELEDGLDSHHPHRVALRRAERSIGDDGVRAALRAAAVEAVEEARPGVLRITSLHVTR